MPRTSSPSFLSKRRFPPVSNQTRTPHLPDVNSPHRHGLPWTPAIGHSARGGGLGLATEAPEAVDEEEVLEVGVAPGEPGLSLREGPNCEQGSHPVGATERALGPSVTFLAWHRALW